MSGRVDGKAVLVRNSTHLSPADDPGSKSTSTKDGFYFSFAALVENTFRSRGILLVEAVSGYVPVFPLKQAHNTAGTSR